MPLPPALAGPAGNPSRKSGKERKSERSDRVVRTVYELVAEYLSAKTKIVPASRQRDRIRHIEIVVHRFILVVRGVAKLERAQYLDERQASLLRVVHTGNPDRLSRQWTRSRASTGDAGEARAELIDGLRGENVGLRNRQIPVLEVTKCRKPWHSCA